MEEGKMNVAICRTPEYLGKKIGPREVKLALIALLMHPLVILFPTGLFATTNWGVKAESNPGPHGFSQIVYQFSSDSADFRDTVGGHIQRTHHTGAHSGRVERRKVCTAWS
jgi:K+-transporting ATPase A subunit